MTTSTNQPVNPLADILTKYAVPDPKIVGKLPKGGTQLDFVGHADITRILLEIDPTWRWVPIAWDNGRPAIHVENGIATMWGELTVLGQARLGVGSVRADKQELDKELVGDFLRNAAMRFGICLSLWTKQEWEDLGGKPSSVTTTRATGQAQQRNISSQPAEPVDADAPLSQEQIEAFNAACGKAELSPIGIYKKANVKFGSAKQSDLAALRTAFKEATAKPAPTETEE
ncbi:MAG: hypothetical protein EBW68_06590 [Actinobacteria bacterium]|nr:hypothetical protein [Actinomycetota bacterium]